MNRRDWLISIAALTAAGCADQTDPRALALREKFLTTTVPVGERPMPDVRKDLKSGALTSDATFTVRARINAGDFSPFGDGLASFLITDATGHDGDESHNPHECPFCKRDIKNMTARVEFMDESGTVARIDSREAFAVKEFDLVVIEGRGRFDEDDTLIMNATRMSVRR